MRLLRTSDTGDVEFIEYTDINYVPAYAILSHTWGVDDEEVKLDDIRDGIGKNKSGYAKIMFCAQQAARDCLQYFWIDTCCIDPSSSSQLSEAINSMFYWYKNASRCYVYLSDVSINKRKASFQSSEYTWESSFRQSRWFTRSWTLQELVAPPSVEFFCHQFKKLGDKETLSLQIYEITGIAIAALQGAPLHQFCIEERLSWAQKRVAKRPEDEAYSLFGIFDINLPVIYGEGREKAMKRLLKEIDTSRVDLAPSTEIKIYPALQGSGFRIFILNPGTDGSEITGYIQEFDLLVPPDYNAVSYIWGDQPAVHRIDVNHRQVFIRPNLFQALQRMRNCMYPILLWVDSLCINQSDKSEKSAQIRQMADIYQKAKNVWIWLGEEDLTSNIAMDIIPKIIKHDFHWAGAWWKEYDFTAFDLLLERAWFRRRWVIQEAAYSKNLAVICGSRRVDMNDFSRAVCSVRARLGDTSSTLDQTQDERAPNGVLFNFRDSPATRLLDVIEQVFHRSDDGSILARKLSLETIVDLTSFCETTDPRDIIFALLNLASDAGSASQADSSISLIGDYSKSLLDVFTDFIMHCCLSSGSLDIICRPWATLSHSTPYAKRRAGRLGSEFRFDLPSWIACKGDLPFSNPFQAISRQLQGKSLVGSSQNRTYNAHHGTKPQVYFGRAENTGAFNACLHAKGILLGEITQRSTRIADAIITYECLEILGMDSPRQRLGTTNLPDAVWRSLCADRDDKGEPAPSTFRLAMAQLFQISRRTLANSDHENQMISVTSIDVQELLETELPEEVEKFLKSIRDVIQNRRAFRGNRNNRPGNTFVGLVPQFAEPGDQLCILYGCSVPIVLRKCWQGHQYHWELIGEAYIDEYMEGAGVSSLSQEMLEFAEVEFEIK